MDSLDLVRHDVLRLARASLERALSDWGVQLGFEASLGEGWVRTVEAAEELDGFPSAEPYLEVTTRICRAAEGPVRLFLPMALVTPLVAAALGEPAPALPSGAEAFDDERLDALREMMNLLCGSANVIYEAYGLRMSQRVDEIQVALREPGVPDAVRGVVVGLPCRVGDAPAGELHQVVSVPLAHELSRATAHGPAG